VGWPVRVQFPTGATMGFFSLPPLHPDQHWGLPSLLSSGCQKLLP